MNAYNGTPHQSTNKTPFESTLGRKAIRMKLPVDSVFQQATTEGKLKKNTKNYIIEDQKKIRIIEKHGKLEKGRKEISMAKATKIDVEDTLPVKRTKFEETYTNLIHCIYTNVQCYC